MQIQLYVCVHESVLMGCVCVVCTHIHIYINVYTHQTQNIQFCVCIHVLSTHTQNQSIGTASYTYIFEGMDITLSLLVFFRMLICFLISSSRLPW